MWKRSSNDGVGTSNEEDMKTETRKCCACGKDVELRVNDIPPTWFARYRGSEIDRAIHSECARKPENNEWWKD
jgi:hypothetical protein